MGSSDSLLPIKNLLTANEENGNLNQSNERKANTLKPTNENNHDGAVLDGDSFKSKHETNIWNNFWECNYNIITLQIYLKEDIK